MKKFILLFLTFIPLLSMGQATEAQKQEALSAASKFCSLLAQFSNGGVTYLGNDQKYLSCAQHLKCLPLMILVLKKKCSSVHI